MLHPYSEYRSGSRSRKLLNTDPIRIRIYNTDLPPPRTTLWGVRRQIVLRKTIVVVENLVTLSLQNTQLGSVFKIKIVFLSMYLVQVITVAYDDRLRPLRAFLYRELCVGDHGGVWWPAAPVWYQQADRCSLQQQGNNPRPLLAFFYRVLLPVFV